jgi:putative acetyltransferase
LVILREERSEDIEAIRAVNFEAFGQPQEGRLVDALRDNGGVLLSMVAVSAEQIIGHILYSPVSIATSAGELIGAGLGPMAVHPDFQRQGIGSRLVEAGNQKIRDAGYPFIVVLGHPQYYPRFGFQAASRHGIRCEWDVPDNVFMMLVLDEMKMKNVSGLAKYREEFASAA